MRILSLRQRAIVICVAVVMLEGCNSGGAQVTPSGSLKRTAVAHATQRISPDGIVYTPAHVRIVDSQYNLGLNNDGTTDFVITESTRPVRLAAKPVA